MNTLRVLIACVAIGGMGVCAGYAIAIADMKNSPIVQAEIARNYGVTR